MYQLYKNVYFICMQLVMPQLIFQNGVHSLLHKPPLWALSTNSTQSPPKPTVSYRRQRGAPEGMNDLNEPPMFKPPPGQLGASPGGQIGAATRFSTKRTTSYRRKRTTQEHISLAEHCDYILHFCIRGYQTGKVCGKSVYFHYFTFKNYCMLDWMNCILRYEMWQGVHMGDCFPLIPNKDVVYYDYNENYVVEQYFVQEIEK